MTPNSNDPAEARKRRKEIIQSQRSENESIANGATALSSNASTASSSLTSGTNGNGGKGATIVATGDEAPNAAANDANGNGTEKKPPKKRKVSTGDPSLRKSSKNDSFDDSKLKKTQIRYDPDVPMNKDQLAAWRREARRVRNRESAAASRQRIRNRISELEDEVGDWKTKYSQAIQRLEALERCIAANVNNEPDQQATEQKLTVQQEPQGPPAAPSAAPLEETI